MSIAINEYQFDGPYQDQASLKNSPGVYAVMVWKSGGWRLLDLGESEHLVDTLSQHPRQQEWQLYAKKKQRAYAALYRDSQEERVTIEATIREQSNPPCGSNT